MGAALFVVFVLSVAIDNTSVATGTTINPPNVASGENLVHGHVAVGSCKIEGRAGAVIFASASKHVVSCAVFVAESGWAFNHAMAFSKARCSESASGNELIQLSAPAKSVASQLSSTASCR